jgi:hypothetical protein
VVDTSDKVSDTLLFRQDTTKTVRGLTPSTHYYFRVIVTTSRYLISASNIVDTTTIKARNAELPLFRVENVTDSSFTARWAKSWHNNFSSYQVYLDTSGIIDSNKTPIQKVTINNVDSTTWTFTGLDYKKRYSYKVFIYVDTGCITSSKVDTVTTKDGIPAAVSLSAPTESITDTSAFISWTKNLDSDFRQYIVCFDTTTAVDTFKSIPTLLPNMVARTFNVDTTAIVAPLKPKSEYWLAVYVQDQKGLLSFSNKLKIKTDTIAVVQ